MADFSFIAKQHTGTKKVFPLLFLLTLLLYIPAAKAGWVIDAAGFLWGLKHQGFWEFINRTHSEDQSFYQLFMLQYYIGYKLWGLNLWMWSLLYITLQSVNAYLLFVFGKTVLADSGVKNNITISLCGALLFAVCPHVSEIVICKAYYHYLQSFLFILLTMLWVIRYQHSRHSKYIWGAAILFVLSAFTLEIFYLLPFFVLTLAIYYRYALGYDKAVYRKTIIYFFIPQLIMLGVYFVGLYAVFHFLRPHKIALTISMTDYLSKPVKYLFHIVLLGRYFPTHAKETFYAFCESTTVLVVFYGTAISAFLYAAICIKKLSGTGKAILLLCSFAVLTIGFVIPLSFPGAGLLVFYDRYTYFADGFIYILLALLLYQILSRKLATCIIVVYGLANLYFTIELNTWWKHSAYITNRLLHELPPPGNKTILLLNIPENMNGIPMIGAQPDGEYKVLREIFVDTTIRNKIYDVASYNMLSKDDGAYVTVINDSVIHVTLDHWGTWWWYGGQGAASYANEDYKLNVVDPGHWYELTLKHPQEQYLLLYEVGDRWRTVDMSKKNQDQY